MKSNNVESSCLLVWNYYKIRIENKINNSKVIYLFLNRLRFNHQNTSVLTID